MRDWLSKLWKPKRSVICDLPPKRALLIVALVSCAFALVRKTSVGESLESFVSQGIEFNVRHWLHRDPVLDPRIKIYAIGDTSLNELKEEELELEDWAKLLKSFDKARPHAVLIDKVFSAPRGSKASPFFSKTLKSLHYPVTAGAFVSKASIPSRSMIPPTDLPSLFHGTDTSREMDSLEWLEEEGGYAYGPVAEIRDSFHHLGHLMYAGNLRIKPAVRMSRHQVMPAAALTVAPDLHFSAGSLYVNGARVPLDARGLTTINLSFPSAYYDRTFKLSGAVARARRGESTELDKDAVVILLPSMYTGATDLQPSPFGTLPGGFFIAALVNSALTGQWIQAAPWGGILVLLAGLAAYLVLVFSAGPLYFMWLTLLSLSLSAAGLYSFAWQNTEVPWVVALITLWSTSIILFVSNARRAQLNLLTIGEVEKDFSAVLDKLRDGQASEEGVRLGRYHILELIGVGGMGEVYRAKSYGAGGFTKEFAIKRINFKERGDSKALRRFETEARLNNILTHGNIVQVFEFFRMKDTYLLVMEFIHGKSLAQLLQNIRGPIPVPLAVYIANEMCKGLEYAHEKKDWETGVPLGIVHRDISPQNVVISHEGAVKLIDFGIAKGDFPREQTPTGTLRGKFLYMSPEQANSKEVDHRSDLFSAALVLYELLTGVKIMAGESEVETIRNVIRCAIPKATVLNPSLPPELDQILLNGLAPSPADRYPTATAFRQALEQFLAEYRKRAPAYSIPVLVKQVFEASAKQPASNTAVDPNSVTADLATRKAA